MSSYKLNIMFDSDSLPANCESDESVLLAKKHISDDEGDTPNVSWVSFKPFVKNNIEWSDDFAVYASNDFAQQNDSEDIYCDVKADIIPSDSIDICLQTTDESGIVLKKIGSVNLPPDLDKEAEHIICYDAVTGDFFLKK